jgi:hypothetical protein
MTLTNATIYGNRGTGIYGGDGEAILKNTIVANKRALGNSAGGW